MRKISLRVGSICRLAPLVVILVSVHLTGQEKDLRRLELYQLLSRLPLSEYFNRWLVKTGDLPPDFDTLPSRFTLPDPLIWTRGGREQKVLRAEWPERRRQLSAQVEKWLLGTAPPPPRNLVADILEKSRDRGHEVWKVRLRFGPNHAAHLSVTLYLPRDQSQPSPIFLCDSERYIGWAEEAMAGGFGFAAHGARDREDESFAYADLFGDYDWSSFRRRGWSASRVVDWLETLPFVDKHQIYIGGHSRSGKAATAGAVFDERIAGLIASSPGSGGGGTPYRYADQSYFGESAELLTRRFPDWVHPRVRFFCGREDKLPTDSHILYALMAPRPMLMSTATEDSVESTWTVEQVYKITQPVYELLGVPKNLAFRYRPGLHSTDAATSVAFSQFLLTASGGKEAVGDLLPFKPIHVWDYEDWVGKNPPQRSVYSFPRLGMDDPTLDANGRKMSAQGWSTHRTEILRQVEWLFGEGPEFRPLPVEYINEEPEELVRNLRRFSIAAAETRGMRFGDGIQGYVYLPEGDGRRPAIVWLAPFQTSRGFIASGYRNATPSPEALVQAGFVTVTFDPIGTGARQAERQLFYEKYPAWSLMGKMVEDARQAVDAALRVPEVDPDRVYLYGYAMGGMAAAFTAALDDRVAGIVTVAGFTPMRTDTEGRRTGGVRRLSHLYGWLPRLGPFVGQEQRIPVDFHEVLASMAPRPVLVIAPTLDRYTTPEEVAEAVLQARTAFALMGAEDGIELQTPYDENRLTDAMQGRVIAWLKACAAAQNNANEELEVEQMRIYYWLVVGFLMASCGRPQPQTSTAPAGLEEMLTAYLTEIADSHLQERARVITALETPDDVAERKEYARSRMLESFGGFPQERTPLRARISGVLERDGYRIEKLIYESLPDFYVTANVYVPLGAPPPFPAVLITAGHGWSGKAGSSSQQLAGSLARRGILALAYDPIGQGERLQYFDPEQGRSLAGRGPTHEHKMADWQCRLTGGSFARYEIWDGVRAVDYLQERGDVDPERIGVAGNSGGGTQAAYLAALEPRLAAAVSVCYMTNWKTLWAGPGPQDAEQSLTGFLANGLDFGDIPILFAPKPFEIIAGTLDYFPLEGARATAAEACRIYEILGRPEAAGFFENEGPHGYLLNRREETVRWMQKWLNDRPDDAGDEPPITLLPEEALYCTPTGQLSTSLKGRTVHELNRELAERQYAERTAVQTLDAAKLRSMIAKRLKTTVPLVEQRPVPPATDRGETLRNGYRMEEVFLETEQGITVPALVLAPEGGEERKPAILFVNSAGKTAGMTRGEGRDASYRWDAESMVEAGFVVMAPDLRGWGESTPRHPMNPGSTGYSIEYQTAQRALLLGRTLVGMQVDDLLRSFDWLASHPAVDPERIALFGKGDGGTVALYAAALEPRIRKVVAEGALSSYLSVARWKFHDNVERIIVPGVLEDFDLPDVVGAIAPRPTWIVSPLTPTRMAASLSEVSEDYAPARAAFERSGRGDEFRILPRVPGMLFQGVYGAWMTP